MTRRTFPTQPKHVHLAGMSGINRVRFLAVIEHGRGTREVAVDVPPDLILRIADALRATAGHACSSRNARIADAIDGKPNVGHAIWHVEHPDMPMPCVDHSTVIEVNEQKVLGTGDEHERRTGKFAAPQSAVTAGTITDEQVRVLFGNGLINADTAHEALNETVWPNERARARARCAEILNERAKAVR